MKALDAPALESRSVVLWRFESLRAAGYGEREALELSMRREVDLHLALLLVERGCDHETALRILR
jgi:hypothetical protein